MDRCTKRRITKQNLKILLIAVILGACSDQANQNSPIRLRTTYEKYLILATRGDPEAQNLVGFMLFLGENVAEDQQQAHFWFHSAARQGHQTAQLNLSFMHGQMQFGAFDQAEAEEMYAAYRVKNINAPPTVTDAFLVMRGTVQKFLIRGRKNYEIFCAGCHGLNGVARFIGSPSFALNQRLEKSDAELFRNITMGRGIMPGWGAKISDVEVMQIIAYIRTFPERYRNGISIVLRRSPDLYFTFGPMLDQPFSIEEPAFAPLKEIQKEITIP